MDANRQRKDRAEIFGDISIFDHRRIAWWSTSYWCIKTLEESLEYRSLAGALALFKQSGVEFLTEYRAAYTAMDAFITDIWSNWGQQQWFGWFGEGVTVSVITTDGALAYKSGSTIEQVIADTYNYNNNPAVSAAVATYNGNVCIAKYGHYTEEEKKIIEAGYNIGVDVKAVRGIQSTSRDSGDDFVNIYNIAKTMSRVPEPWILRGDLASFNDSPDILFTTIVSQSRGLDFSPIK